MFLWTKIIGKSMVDLDYERLGALESGMNTFVT